MKKVLIIEDDQIVANIYRNKLSVEGFKVEIALDGEAGLATVKEFRPDAILLDLMLPLITGVEVMKQLRADPDFAQTPVIVFSNTYLTNMVQDAWKAGATKCLSKSSCTPKHVIDALRSTLNITTPATMGAPAAGPKPAAAPVQVSAPVTPPANEKAAERTTTSDGDVEFQAQLRAEFATSLPATLTALRSHMQGLIKSTEETERTRNLHDLYRRVHSLTSNAGVAGLPLIAQMADATEALLKELYEKPKNINASTLRTLASAIDFLGTLFVHGSKSEQQEIAPIQILVVDDEAISRRALTYALEKARLKSINVEDPLVAFQLLSEKSFDLIFLDVDMPNMTGFELCSKLRSLARHKTTPVVFVTSLTDFESRANSTMSGGNDFIAKPFMFIELAVKALVYALRSKVPSAK